MRFTRCRLGRKRDREMHKPDGRHATRRAMPSAHPVGVILRMSPEFPPPMVSVLKHFEGWIFDFEGRIDHELTQVPGIASSRPWHDRRNGVVRHRVGRLSPPEPLCGAVFFLWSLRRLAKRARECAPPPRCCLPCSRARSASGLHPRALGTAVAALRRPLREPVRGPVPVSPPIRPAPRLRLTRLARALRPPRPLHRPPPRPGASSRRRWSLPPRWPQVL